MRKILYLILLVCFSMLLVGCEPYSLDFYLENFSMDKDIELSELSTKDFKKIVTEAIEIERSSVAGYLYSESTENNISYINDVWFNFKNNKVKVKVEMNEVDNETDKVLEEKSEVMYIKEKYGYGTNYSGKFYEEHTAFEGCEEPIDKKNRIFIGTTLYMNPSLLQVLTGITNYLEQTPEYAQINYGRYNKNLVICEILEDNIFMRCVFENDTLVFMSGEHKNADLKYNVFITYYDVDIKFPNVKDYIDSSQDD